MKRNQGVGSTRAAIVSAMRKQRPITVTYTKADGSETVRTVEPYMITRSKAGDWYVKAMDRQSGQARSWRLDRIVFYTVHRTSFLLPPYVPTSTPAPVEPESPCDPDVTAVPDDNGAPAEYDWDAIWDGMDVRIGVSH